MPKTKKRLRLEKELAYYVHEKKLSLIVGVAFLLVIFGGILWASRTQIRMPTITISSPLKAPTATPPLPTPTPSYILYTLKEDENLWEVAQRFYGEPQMYSRIALDNNFPEPDYIAPGTTLKLYGVKVYPTVKK